MDTTMLVKTKKDLKNKAQKLAHELGLSLTDVVNVSLRQFVINQGITISKIPTENLEVYSNKKAILSAYKNLLLKAKQEIKDGKALKGDLDKPMKSKLQNQK